MWMGETEEEEEDKVFFSRVGVFVVVRR